MELAGNIFYPRRSFIKYLAKKQLILEDYGGEPLDEVLFQEIAAILFHRDKKQKLYQPYCSKEKAAEVEISVRDELVQTYRQIKQRQGDLIVQKLNALL